MGFPLEVADKFGKTFFDVWRMKPRDFLDLRNDDPTCYLSPYQFLGLCITLTLSMILVNLGLVDGVLKEVAQYKSETEVSARAGRLVILFLLMTFIASLFVAFFARRWPIRRSVTVKTIFEFVAFGMGAMLVPVSAMDVLVNPILIELVLREKLPVWSIYVPMAVGYVLGGVMFFTYFLPGYSHILKASKTRIFWGLLFWSWVVGFVIGLAIGFIAGFSQGLNRAAGA